MKKGKIKRLFMIGGLAVGLLTGCTPYRIYEESEELGATVTKVYGKTTIEHSGSGIGRTSYEENHCHVTVAYHDGYVKTYKEQIDPVTCYTLQPGDWVDGWTVKRYRENKETQEVELINMTRHVDLAQEIAKQLRKQAEE